LDNESHHIAYKKGVSTGWLCSDPVRLEEPFSGQNFLAQMRQVVAGAHLVEAQERFFDQLVDEILFCATHPSEPDEVADTRTAPSLPTLRAYP
jgi:hypothetical protein